MKDSIKITKTKFFYKNNKGTFKNLYAHKYLKIYNATKRKSFIRYKLSKNPNSKTYHGKFYRKNDIKKLNKTKKKR